MFTYWFTTKAQWFYSCLIASFLIIVKISWKCDVPQKNQTQYIYDTQNAYITQSDTVRGMSRVYSTHTHRHARTQTSLFLISNQAKYFEKKLH